MPAAYKGLGDQDQSAGNATITPTLPSGWAAGDFAVTFAYADSGSMSTPTGWTVLTGAPFSGPGNEKIYLWYRRLATGDGNPSTTISSAASASDEFLARIMTFSGVDRDTPIDAVGSANSGTSATGTNNGVTTLYPALLVVMTGIGVVAYTTATGSFGGSSANVTSRLDTASALGNGGAIKVFTKSVASPGASGSWSSTVGVSGPYASLTFALRDTVLFPARPRIASQAVTRAATR